MEVREVPRIILRGDEEAASLLAREGIRQLGILKNLMKFQDLKQDVRKIRYTDGSEIVCRSVYGVEDIQIYVPRRFKEKREPESARFFARTRKNNVTKFYWIKFVESRDDVKIQIFSMNISKDVLLKVVNLPLILTYTGVYPSHVFTKSFMIKKKIDKEDKKVEIEERWVATPHLLLKDHEIFFNPLGYPRVEVEWQSLSYYPYPAYCPGHGILNSWNPCPPNRFYCNTEERVMVWYTCRTGIEPYPPYLSISLCFGIVLRLTDNMEMYKYYSPAGTEYQKLVDIDSGNELIKIFNCDSSEAEDKGFNPLWYYKKPDPDCIPPNVDPMCGADSDLPTQMLMDVGELDKDKIEVLLPWRERPVKIIVDLSGKSFGTTEEDHTIEQVEESDHWYWSEEGFTQELFAELSQSHIQGHLVQYTDSPKGEMHPGCSCEPPVECVEGECTLCIHPYTGKTPTGESGSAAMTRIESSVMEGCGGHIGKVRETFQGQWQRTYWRAPYGQDTHHHETVFKLSLPSDDLHLKTIDREIVTVQGAHSEAEFCQGIWDTVGWVEIEGDWYQKWQLTECTGPHLSTETNIRYIGETLRNKLTKSFTADWCSPNVVVVGEKRDRTYVDAFEEMGRYNRSWSTVKGEDIQYCSAGCGYGNGQEDKYFADDYWGEPGSGHDLCDLDWPSFSFFSYLGVSAWGAPLGQVEFSMHTSLTDYAYGDPFPAGHIDPNYNRKRSCDVNTIDKTPVLEYRIGENIKYSLEEYNRTYYLDDRSSEDSQGLLVGARGATVREYGDDPYYEVFTWNIKYQPPGSEDFIDVTDKLLKALDCTVDELIEIGLI